MPREEERAPGSEGGGGGSDSNLDRKSVQEGFVLPSLRDTVLATGSDVHLVN